MVTPLNRPSDDSTRREFLRSGAAALAGSAAMASAGCSSALPPLGTRVDFTRIDVPDASTPEYRRWLPAPSLLGDDRDHYSFLFREPGPIDYRAPVRFTVPKKSLLLDLDYFGVGYENYDRLLSTPFGVVLEGEFDRAAVTETLSGSGYSAAGSYEGYDRFERSDVPRQAAVGDGAVVWASQRVHDGPDIEALIDAGAGRAERYHEASEDFRTLSDVVGESRMVEFLKPEDGVRSWIEGEGFRFDGETAYHVVSHLYPEGQTPPEERLRRRSVQDATLTREVEQFEYTSDGRLATVAGRVPAGTGVDPTMETYPTQITWSGSYDPDAGTFTLRHEAGETVAADTLSADLIVDRDGVVNTGELISPWPDVDTVGPDDVATIGVGSDPTVPVREGAADEVDEVTQRPATHLELDWVPESARYIFFKIPLEGSA